MTPRFPKPGIAVTRRAFVVGAGALSAATAIPATAARAGTDRQALMLFDGAIEDGRHFAAIARSAGQVAQDTGRDLAQLLYGERRDWARDPRVMLAGVTRYADFQVASGIAREQGRSVIGALAREKQDGPVRLIAGSSAGLLTFAECLSSVGFAAKSVDELVREAGSIAWICA